MSHFTQIRTQLRNLEMVREALIQLGYEVTGAGPVHGYAGGRTDADLVVDTGTNYDIGFREEDDSVVLVADFWGLKIDRQKFLHAVTQRYAYLTVLEQADQQGWATVTEEVQVDGSIRLVMQRWG